MTYSVIGDLHKDENIHQEAINSPFEEKENWEDVKKDVESPPDKLKLQLKKVTEIKTERARRRKRKCVA